MVSIKLWSGISVRVMARAWVGVKVKVLFFTSIAKYLAILCIPYCADVE